jgi:hypothetical protein
MVDRIRAEGEVGGKHQTPAPSQIAAKTMAGETLPGEDPRAK